MPMKRFAAVALLACAVTTNLAGQVVRVVVQDSATGSPMPRMLVDAIDARGKSVVSTLTLEDGSRSFALPTGTYRIRVRRAGYQTIDGGNVVVAKRDTVVARVAVQLRKVDFPVATADETTACTLADRERVSPSRVRSVWEQVRTGMELSRAILSDERLQRTRNVLQHALTRFAVRESGFELLQHTVLQDETAFIDAFSSFMPELLSGIGYIQQDGQIARELALNEQVLSSNDFLSEHCFTLVVDSSRHRGEIGVHFAPLPKQMRPDVEGTVWADSATGVPTLVEYAFVDRLLPANMTGPGRAGGNLLFRRLPDGASVLTAWMLRMPRRVRTRMEADVDDNQMVEIVAAIVPVDAADGSGHSDQLRELRRRFRRGSLEVESTIESNLSALPVGRVRVRQRADSVPQMLQTFQADAKVRTPAKFHVDTTLKFAPNGRVLIEGLPPGNYDVQVAHVVDSIFGVEPETMIVAVQSDSLARLVSRSAVSSSLAACTADIMNKTSYGIYGTVRLGSPDLPMRASRGPAQIVASWRDEKGELRLKGMPVDQNGGFSLCGFTQGAPVTLQLSAAFDVGADERLRVLRLPLKAQVVRLNQWRAVFVPMWGFVPPNR
jgi:hypothetical protein